MTFLQADEYTLINLDHISTISRKGATLIFSFGENREKIIVEFADGDCSEADCCDAFDGLTHHINAHQFQSGGSNLESYVRKIK